MSLARSIRLALKHLRQIIAGFASVQTFTCGRIKKYPYSENEFALEQDRLEVKSDIERAAFKSQNNERKQQQTQQPTT